MNNDLISREALLKEVRENKELFEKERIYLEGLLLNAPTVDCSNELSEMTFSHALTTEERQDLTRAFLIGKRSEQRPQGEWIVDEDNVFQNYMKCSICNEGAEWLDGGSQFLSNYCPNCGAKMLGGSK